MNLANLAINRDPIQDQKILSLIDEASSCRDSSKNISIEPDILLTLLYSYEMVLGGRHSSSKFYRR